MVLVHTGVPISVSSLCVPPLSQSTPRLPAAPGAAYRLLPTEVLSEHQIHLGRLPLAVSLALAYQRALLPLMLWLAISADCQEMSGYIQCARLRFTALGLTLGLGMDVRGSRFKSVLRNSEARSTFYGIHARTMVLPDSVSHAYSLCCVLYQDFICIEMGPFLCFTFLSVLMCRRIK